MKIMVSACLLGENVKYNGGNNMNRTVLDYVQGHEVIAVCPEVMGGLPVPRVPAEVKNGIVCTEAGENVDHQFHLGAEKTLAVALREKPDLIILKAKSPSCGVKQRYDGTFSHTVIDEQGVTAGLLKEYGFNCLDEEDL